MRTFTSPHGLPVFVGRTARENDALTSSAAMHDLWFHARDVPGAHVVLRLASKSSDASPECIRFAASLALRYSKAPLENVRRVDVCYVRDVTKPKKAKPGLVEISRSWIVEG